MASKLVYRMPLTKLVELDGDICLNLAALMVTTLDWAGMALDMSKGIEITMIMREVLNNMLLKEASHYSDTYGLISRQVLGLGVEGMPKEVKHCNYLESRFF